MYLAPLLLTVLLSIAIPATGFAQISGCPDPQATNYNASATVNDGSCKYSVTSYSSVFIANLSTALNECLGLAYINGQLWSHNDGGNASELYRVNPVDGSVMRTVVIANAHNTDWESMTQNGKYLFVGDFGNNNGDRTDLNILKISIDDIANAANDTVQAAVIRFSYSDQTVFTSAQNNNNYDCEAFFYSNDSLHLFSKNWVDLKAKHYVLPADTGTYIAQLIDTFNIDGLITDAAINDSGTFVLLGYKDFGSNLYSCFAWLMYDYPAIHHYFGGNKRRIDLGLALTLGQTEGITLFNDNTGYISSEKVLSLPAKLHSFNIDQYISDMTTDSKPVNDTDFGIIVYPNHFTEMLVVNNRRNESTGYELTDVSGKVIFKGNLSPGITTFNTGKIATGIYFFTAIGTSVKLMK